MVDVVVASKEDSGKDVEYPIGGDVVGDGSLKYPRLCKHCIKHS